MAGLAVLDVIDDEDLVAHAAPWASCCGPGCARARPTARAVHGVRGRGLLVGVDLAGTPAAGSPAVLDRARDQGVLIGTTGPRYDVLKIRPPLVDHRRPGRAGRRRRQRLP